MKLRLLGALAIACMAGSPVFADVVESSNQTSATTITDNDPNGVTSVVNITANETIQEARFGIEGLDHTWIGDLIMTVTHTESGKSATLMHRVGGAALLGDSSDVNGTYMFETAATNSIWTAASNTADDEVVAVGTYQATEDGEVPVDLDTIFGGGTTAGEWVFNISDNNLTQGGSGEPEGSFLRTSVNFRSVAVPEPGTMATVMFGTLLGGIYLRRRHQKKNS
jgi:hypothetical protein